MDSCSWLKWVDIGEEVFHYSLEVCFLLNMSENEDDLQDTNRAENGSRSSGLIERESNSRLLTCIYCFLGIPLPVTPPIGAVSHFISIQGANRIHEGTRQSANTLVKSGASNHLTVACYRGSLRRRQK